MILPVFMQIQNIRSYIFKHSSNKILKASIGKGKSEAWVKFRLKYGSLKNLNKLKTSITLFEGCVW